MTFEEAQRAIEAAWEAGYFDDVVALFPGNHSTPRARWWVERRAAELLGVDCCTVALRSDVFRDVRPSPFLGVAHFFKPRLLHLH